MITRRRAAELSLLCAEAALAARAPDAARPPADLAEWLAVHAGVCPELAARLRRVSRLLAWSGPRAQVDVAPPGPAGASSARVNAELILTFLGSREVAEQLRITPSGGRYLAARGRLPGARRNRVTGRWEIPLGAVTAYREQARRRGRVRGSGARQVS